jgi:hypothetical protein
LNSKFWRWNAERFQNRNTQITNREGVQSFV